MNWGHIAPTAPDTLGSFLRNSLTFYAKAKLEAWGEQGECWLVSHWVFTQGQTSIMGLCNQWALGFLYKRVVLMK